ncbi:hypothetical protein HPB52_024881 [Rhipicephalus sanguineus]|uniref:Uncharacterized protein n=1 Tax=Rhipicephalus sanguineus TaxID=34632 RepID=A0A9D4PAW9_RHISA|nr:hypothetical protein HPB52_024881 [Rhipicephalus sanguineus]
MPLVQRLRKDLLLCGASMTTTPPGEASSAIDVSLATERCHYTWIPLLDTWRSDHLPLVFNPIRGKTARRHLATAGRRERKNGRHQVDRPKWDSKTSSTWSTEVLGAVRNLEPLDSVSPCGRRPNAPFPVTSELQLAGRVDHSPNGQRGWRLLTPLLLGLYRQRQSLSVAVHMGISAEALAELPAGQFPSRPVLQAPPPSTAARSIAPRCHHVDWVAEKIQVRYNEPIHIQELKAALE